MNRDVKADPLGDVEWRILRLVAGPEQQLWLLNEVKGLRAVREVLRGQAEYYRQEAARLRRQLSEVESQAGKETGT